MNQQLVVGVIVPVAVVIVLITLSSFGPEFEVNHAIVDSVSLAELQSNNPVKLEAISVKNNFFMPRKYSLPDYIACVDENQIIPISYQPTRIYTDRSTLDLAAYEQKTIQLYLNTYKGFNASEIKLVQTDGWCDSYLPEEVIKTIQIT